MDAIQTMGKKRRKPASAMIHCLFLQTPGPLKNAISVRGLQGRISIAVASTSLLEDNQYISLKRGIVRRVKISRDNSSDWCSPDVEIWWIKHRFNIILAKDH